ncbi:phosphoribosylformylglycinamidine cyclo-ligase [Oenococcus sp.]|uniref:phosphoribosylformylglycinamidine cyclo-ligase n=1 Tax=Oenococcus sp. TaxID=1979414 RepID=UPI0039EC2348
MSEDAYAKSGVDIKAGEDAVAKISDSVKSTYTDGVLDGIGSFGSFFQLPAGYKNPVLVSGTDGVGSKLLLAQAADQHGSIGQDLVAMVANDILVQGAKPLFMLDYLAIDHVESDKVAKIVAGIADGARQAGMALIGGEMAELADMYPKNEYDLAGFAVGVVDKTAILDGSRSAKGDVLLGLASNGLHSNGFSLVRQLLMKNPDLSWAQLDPNLQTELLKPTRIYVKALLPLMQAHRIHAAAHITGGGMLENLPRMLNNNVTAEIHWGTWPIPAIFKRLQTAGQLSDTEMLRTFNLGIGLVVTVAPDQAAAASESLKAAGEQVYPIGHLIKRAASDQALTFVGQPDWSQES